VDHALPNTSSPVAPFPPDTSRGPLHDLRNAVPHRRERSACLTLLTALLEAETSVRELWSRPTSDHLDSLSSMSDPYYVLMAHRPGLAAKLRPSCKNAATVAQPQCRQVTLVGAVNAVPWRRSRSSTTTAGCFQPKWPPLQHHCFAAMAAASLVPVPADVAVRCQREQIQALVLVSVFSQAYESSPTPRRRDVSELIPWLSKPT